MSKHTSHISFFNVCAAWQNEEHQEHPYHPYWYSVIHFESISHHKLCFKALICSFISLSTPFFSFLLSIPQKVIEILFKLTNIQIKKKRWNHFYFILLNMISKIVYLPIWYFSVKCIFIQTISSILVFFFLNSKFCYCFLFCCC